MENELFWQINKPNTEVTGEKHTPVITIIGEAKAGNVVDVVVNVGNGKHPNENAHHIQFVELRANDLFIARAEFTAAITQPVVTFKIIVPTTPIILTAFERCNLHGIWISQPVKLG